MPKSTSMDDLPIANMARLPSKLGLVDEGNNIVRAESTVSRACSSGSPQDQSMDYQPMAKLLSKLGLVDKGNNTARAGVPCHHCRDANVDCLVKYEPTDVGPDSIVLSACLECDKANKHCKHDGDLLQPNLARSTRRSSRQKRRSAPYATPADRTVSTTSLKSAGAWPPRGSEGASWSSSPRVSSLQIRDQMLQLGPQTQRDAPPQARQGHASWASAEFAGRRASYATPLSQTRISYTADDSALESSLAADDQVLVRELLAKKHAAELQHRSYQLQALENDRNLLEYARWSSNLHAHRDRQAENVAVIEDEFADVMGRLQAQRDASEADQALLDRELLQYGFRRR